MVVQQTPNPLLWPQPRTQHLRNPFHLQMRLKLLILIVKHRDPRRRLVPRRSQHIILISCKRCFVQLPWGAQIWMLQTVANSLFNTEHFEQWERFRVWAKADGEQSLFDAVLVIETNDALVFKILQQKSGVRIKIQVRGSIFGFFWRKKICILILYSVEMYISKLIMFLVQIHETPIYINPMPPFYYKYHSIPPCYPFS